YRQHLLSFRICEFVGINPSFVLMHWASEKIQHSLHLTDAQLCLAIHNKFKKYPGMSYAEVAAVAARCTREHLTCLLLEYEPFYEKQVHLLLNISELTLALLKAIAARDCNLVFLCFGAIINQEGLSLMHLEEAVSQFAILLVEKPMAMNLFHTFCIETENFSVLQQFYERLGKMYESGLVALRMAYQKHSWEQYKSWLAFSAGFLVAGKGDSDVSSGFAQAAIVEQIDLLKVQKELEMKAHLNAWPGGPHQFQGFSVMKTIRNLVFIGYSNEASRVQKAFKVSEKQFCRCKMHALADGGHFDDLVDYATARMPPIGVEPFLEACEKHSAKIAAGKIIPKLKDAELEHRWYSQFGLLQEADSAIKRTGGSNHGLFQSISDVLSWRKSSY
ncbi:hypothetical protein IE077_001333, partial [Cardiosporidium cionae]